MKKLKNKKIKISNLSYLHSKIIEEIYLSIVKGVKVSKNEVAKKIHYKPDSRIYENALIKIIEKGFVSGNFEDGFNIPKECNFLLDIVKTKNLKNTVKYKDHISQRNQIQKNLFENNDNKNLIENINSWYSYVEEFSSELIFKQISEQNLSADSIIYDPFIGSGTTSIVANLSGFNSVGFDINPLMSLVSKVNTNWTLNIKKINKEFKVINKNFLKEISSNNKSDFLNSFNGMPIKEIDQWLSLKNRKEISVVKNLISKIQETDIKEFFNICMSKSAFDTSYVALCPGTTFYPFRQKREFWEEFGIKVTTKIRQLESVQKINKFGNSQIFNESCLNVNKVLKKNSIDFAITSPPYPNDLEYTRQTRLELYLLDLVNSMEEVAKIKKKMVKSSTKLIFKESSSSKYIKKFKSINNISNQIEKKLFNRNWGWDYPRMVREYFGDMYLCLKETKKVLKNKSNFVLLCGDQTIQGVYIPVCDILIEMATELGYSKSNKQPYRVRRSSGHKIPLPEDLVVLKK